MGPPRSDEVKAVNAMLDKLGLTERLAALFATPAWTADAILNTLRDGGMVQREGDGAQVMNRARLVDGALPVKERKRLELRNQWDGGFGREVREVLVELGIPTETFAAWLSTDDHLFDFWDSIPSVSVVLNLELASTKQQGRPFEENDFRDMSFNEAAIPYSNILVTEKYWADRIRYANLHKQYDTRLLRRLADLPRALREENCL